MKIEKIKLATKFTMGMFILILATMIITYVINPNLENLLNGVRVPFQMFILSLIPIGYLYLTNAIITSILTGILFGALFRYSIAKSIAFLCSAFPYLFLEIFAYCMLASMLYQINKWVRDKIKHRQNTSFHSEIRALFIDYLKYVIPVIILAAIFETYLADLILKLF
ncbi:stage II sporulation protein M [Lactococcus formosensis subsp. bovis]|uniref:stage II sporulation protein M n=1 Tax=Lactococcus formosensis TaxID=1281486 RepID=UPI001BCB4BA2|nr:stage II sporulation protein M [Lactococcus formosensis]